MSSAMDRAASGLLLLGQAAAEAVALAKVVMPQWYTLAERAVEVGAAGVETSIIVATRGAAGTKSLEPIRERMIEIQYEAGGGDGDATT